MNHTVANALNTPTAPLMMESVADTAASTFTNATTMLDSAPLMVTRRRSYSPTNNNTLRRASSPHTTTSVSPSHQRRLSHASTLTAMPSNDRRASVSSSPRSRLRTSKPQHSAATSSTRLSLLQDYTVKSADISSSCIMPIIKRMTAVPLQNQNQSVQDRSAPTTTALLSTLSPTPTTPLELPQRRFPKERPAADAVLDLKILLLDHSSSESEQSCLDTSQQSTDTAEIIQFRVRNPAAQPPIVPKPPVQPPGLCLTSTTTLSSARRFMHPKTPTPLDAIVEEDKRESLTPFTSEHSRLSLSSHHSASVTALTNTDNSSHDRAMLRTSNHNHAQQQALSLEDSTASFAGDVVVEQEEEQSLQNCSNGMPATNIENVYQTSITITDPMETIMSSPDKDAPTKTPPQSPGPSTTTSHQQKHPSPGRLSWSSSTSSPTPTTTTTGPGSSSSTVDAIMPLLKRHVSGDAASMTSSIHSSTHGTTIMHAAAQAVSELPKPRRPRRTGTTDVTDGTTTNSSGRTNPTKQYGVRRTKSDDTDVLRSKAQKIGAIGNDDDDDNAPVTKGSGQTAAAVDSPGGPGSSSSRRGSILRAKSTDGSGDLGHMRRAARLRALAATGDGANATTNSNIMTDGSTPLTPSGRRRAPLRTKSTDGSMNMIPSGSSRSRTGRNSIRRTKSSEDAAGDRSPRSPSPGRRPTSSISTRDTSGFGAAHQSRFNSSRIKRWDRAEIEEKMLNGATNGGNVGQMQKMMMQSHSNGLFHKVSS